MSNVKVPATSSGFSLDHADALGVKVVHDEPGNVVAEWRQGGAVCAFQGVSVEEVLDAVESWHLTRLRCGAVDPVPVRVAAA